MKTAENRHRKSPHQATLRTASGRGTCALNTYTCAYILPFSLSLSSLPLPFPSLAVSSPSHIHHFSHLLFEHCSSLSTSPLTLRISATPTSSSLCRRPRQHLMLPQKELYSRALTSCRPARRRPPSSSHTGRVGQHATR